MLPLYRVETWLFMSPLKCSNFFSVSSLKEPPGGTGIREIVLGKPDAQVSPPELEPPHPPQAACRATCV